MKEEVIHICIVITDEENSAQGLYILKFGFNVSNEYYISWFIITVSSETLIANVSIHLAEVLWYENLSKTDTQHKFKTI